MKPHGVYKIKVISEELHLLALLYFDIPQDVWKKKSLFLLRTKTSQVISVGNTVLPIWSFFSGTSIWLIVPILKGADKIWNDSTLAKLTKITFFQLQNDNNIISIYVGHNILPARILHFIPQFAGMSTDHDRLLPAKINCQTFVSMMAR